MRTTAVLLACLLEGGCATTSDPGPQRSCRHPPQPTPTTPRRLAPTALGARRERLERALRRLETALAQRRPRLAIGVAAQLGDVWSYERYRRPPGVCLAWLAADAVMLAALTGVAPPPLPGNVERLEAWLRERLGPDRPLRTQNGHVILRATPADHATVRQMLGRVWLTWQLDPSVPPLSAPAPGAASVTRIYDARHLVRLDDFKTMRARDAARGALAGTLSEVRREASTDPTLAPSLEGVWTLLRSVRAPTAQAARCARHLDTEPTCVLRARLRWPHDSPPTRTLRRDLLALERWLETHQPQTLRPLEIRIWQAWTGIASSEPITRWAGCLAWLEGDDEMLEALLKITLPDLPDAAERLGRWVRHRTSGATFELRNGMWVVDAPLETHQAISELLEGVRRRCDKGLPLDPGVARGPLPDRASPCVKRVYNVRDLTLTLWDVRPPPDPGPARRRLAADLRELGRDLGQAPLVRNVLSSLRSTSLRRARLREAAAAAEVAAD